MRVKSLSSDAIAVHFYSVIAIWLVYPVSRVLAGIQNLFSDPWKENK